MADRPPRLPSDTVTEDLRRRIDSGEWQPGDQLPAVHTLAESYGVASRTVSKVLQQLADEGLLKIIPNWGTFRAGAGPQPGNG